MPMPSAAAENALQRPSAASPCRNRPSAEFHSSVTTAVASRVALAAGFEAAYLHLDCAGGARPTATDALVQT